MPLDGQLYFNDVSWFHSRIVGGGKFNVGITFGLMLCSMSDLESHQNTSFAKCHYQEFYQFLF